MKTATFFLLVSGASAVCPGDSPCNGKGSCGQNDLCTCYAGYHGNDCAGRTCPHHMSWNTLTTSAVMSGSDKTRGGYAGVSHGVTECSNKGTCNRDNGVCECDEGFGGSGCRRMLSECGQSGQMMTLKDTDANYNGWDAKMITKCVCDAGYAGEKCEIRMCPLGDDPLTTGQVETVIFLGTGVYAKGVATDGVANNPSYDDPDGTTPEAKYTAHAREFILTYEDDFGKSWSTIPITGDATSAIEVAEALEMLPNFALTDVTVAEVATDTVSVTVSPEPAGGAVTLSAVSKVFSITFTGTPGSRTLGIQTIGCEVSGCDTVYYGTSHVAVCTSTACPPTLVDPAGEGAALYQDFTAAISIGGGSGFTATAIEGTRENTVCAGRGDCSEDGECTCYAGYAGLACEQQTTVM